MSEKVIKIRDLLDERERLTIDLIINQIKDDGKFSLISKELGENFKKIMIVVEE